MSTPCIKFSDLKNMVLNGGGMSHGQIKKVWGRMLQQAGISEHDKLAIAMFSQAITDIRVYLYKYPGYTPDEIIAYAFIHMAPANWVTVVP